MYIIKGSVGHDKNYISLLDTSEQFTDEVIRIRAVDGIDAPAGKIIDELPG